MKKYAAYAMIGVAILILLWGIPGSVRNVGTNDVGVSVNKFSGSMNTYGPGNYILPRLVYGFYTLDTKMRKLEMVLPFKTREGNDIWQKLNITYFVNAKKAPVIIRDWALSMNELDQVVVRIIARAIQRDILGDCETTDYYNTAFRMERGNEAKQQLAEIFSKYFDGIIVIEGENLEEYGFTDKQYQTKISDRKTNDQKTETTYRTIRARQQFYSSELERIEESISS